MCKSVRFRTGSVSSSHLFSHYLSPPSSPSLLFVEAVGTISHGFGDRKCCTQAPPLRVAGVPSSGLVLSPQTPILDTLTNNERHRSPPAGASFLSYVVYKTGKPSSYHNGHMTQGWHLSDSCSFLPASHWTPTQQGRNVHPP